MPLKTHTLALAVLLLVAGCSGWHSPPFEFLDGSRVTYTDETDSARSAGYVLQDSYSNVVAHAISEFTLNGYNTRVEDRTGSVHFAFFNPGPYESYSHCDVFIVADAIPIHEGGKVYTFTQCVGFVGVSIMTMK